MSELRVEMHGELIGRLVGSGDSFDFVASPDAIRAHGLGSVVLSVAVPLLPRASPRSKELRKNFFSELLPEGAARTRLADEARVPNGDTCGMLRAYGRDVAGALQIWDPADPVEPLQPGIEMLDERGVERMLREVAISPLGNKPRRGKTSLNGVQSKIVLVKTPDGWARALDGYPSTHIVKPIVAQHPTMIFDEEYGSRFARGLGLAVFDTHLSRFNDTFALVVTRYDRDDTATDRRIHQEDFNQVLGLSGDQKYETYGGRGLRDIAKQLSDNDRQSLLRMTTLSVALGNLDMHAKNVSLLHRMDGSTCLAPMYDVVPQAHQDNDGELAFRVDGEFAHRLVTRHHLIIEGASWGLRYASILVDSALADIRRIAAQERPDAGAHPNLQYDVLGFTDNLLAGRATRDDGDGLFDPNAPGQRRPDGGWTWVNPQVL